MAIRRAQTSSADLGSQRFTHGLGAVDAENVCLHHITLVSIWLRNRTVAGHGRCTIRLKRVFHLGAIVFEHWQSTIELCERLIAIDVTITQ